MQKQYFNRDFFVALAHELWQEKNDVAREVALSWAAYKEAKARGATVEEQLEFRDLVDEAKDEQFYVHEQWTSLVSLAHKHGYLIVDLMESFEDA